MADDATWTLRGTEWTQIQSSTVPPFRDGQASVYDIAMGRLLVASGRQSSGLFLNDLWQWNGTSATPSLKRHASAPPIAPSQLL